MILDKAFQTQVISQTTDFVKKSLQNAEKGHDWWHIWRVWQNAKYIAKFEQANILVVELGALLHDITDHKLTDNPSEMLRTTRKFLKTANLSKPDINHVINIIQNVSFSQNLVGQRFFSLELAVVQDADRLDAIGAIGIARAFQYGGYKNREIYNPKIKPIKNITQAKYLKNNSPTINHFYEKLLLLKDKMNTKTGRQLAESRHQFMLDFLQQFYREWNLTN